MEKYLEAGVIVNTHGMRGDVKVNNMCDTPKVFSKLKKLYIKRAGQFKEYNCTRNSVLGKNMLVVHLDGVETVEDALKLKGVSVYADREDIPLEEGDYFIADIIGLPVIDNESGEIYGRVTDVFNQGAQDLYEVEKGDGSKALIPAVPHFIIRIDPESGVYVSLIEGML